MKYLKVGLDIDQVLAEFMETYLNRFGEPKTDKEITINVHRTLRLDKNFWETLPVLNTINFIPELYCTKRVNPKIYTKRWLKANNFPDRPVFQMYAEFGNKADMIKGHVDVFIDDSIDNFIQMNLAGVPCLLFDSPYNKSWGPIGRLYSLEYDHIVETYELFMKTTFKEFYKLV